MGKLAALVLSVAACYGLDNSIRIYDTSGAAQTGRPFTVLMVFMQGEFSSGKYPKPRVNGAAPAAWQVDVKSRWPDGSVLTAFVSFPLTLGANGNVKVDFVPDENACHLGPEAACEAAALSQTAMLDFMGGGWNAQIRGTANSISYTVDAKTMIANGDWQYWLRGPVVTRVIVRNNGFAYDFGWQWDGTNWQAPSNDTYKSVHPMFELSFYPGWNGVETGFRVENSWWRKLQNLKLKLEFLAGSPASAVYAKTNYDLEAKAAASYYAWSGAEPGPVFVGRNLPYLVATRILPPYDLSLKLNTSVISSYLSQWPNNVGTDDLGRPDPRSCTTQNPCAYIKTDMPGTGDHPNFGILPRWQAAFLYAMGDDQVSISNRKLAYDRLIVGSGDAAVTIPIHYRESVTQMTPAYRNYFNWPEDQATPSFGRFKSISAHPDGRTGQYDTTGPYPAQYICSNCPAKTHSWMPDGPHWGEFYALPYILTGRWTYLMSMQQAAAHWMGWDHPYYARHFDWGIQYDASNPRGPARMLKQIMWAYLLSPDSPERTYFGSKLKNNDAAYEGALDVRDGIYASQVLADCRGTETTETVNMTWTSSTVGGPNGVRKKFNISSNATHGLRTVSSVKVNSVDQTFGIYGQDTGKDWYWIPGTRLLIQDEAAQPLTPADTLNLQGTIGKSATPWCMGFNLRRWDSNPLPLVGLGSTAYNGSAGAAVTSTAPWQVSYLAMHIGWFRQTGALVENGRRSFEASGAKLAKFYIDGMLHPRKPVLYAGNYGIALQDKAGLITTYERLIAAMNPPVALTQDISAGASSFTINCQVGTAGCVNVPGSSGAVWKIDDEYIRTCGRSTGSGTTTYTVCPGGRGYWGTKAAAHTTSSVVNAEWRLMGDLLSGHTYPNLWVNALATYYDVTATLGSGIEAYQRAVSLGTGLEMRASDQRYALVPRVEPYNLKAIAAPGKAEIHYEAPTLAACRYAVTATEFTSSDDAGDELDRGGLRARRIVLDPLAPGTYRYRVTCGTGRKIGTFTVP
jgi:hypothetical protein